MSILLLLHLLSIIHACTVHRSISCKDERIYNKSDHISNVTWSADPALRLDYYYTQTDKGLSINLEASWRILRSEKFDVPLRGFEVSLHDLTEGRLVEIRNESINSPEEGILTATETIEFSTTFDSSLEFSHVYDIELRILPRGIGSSFKERLSIPPFPQSAKCDQESPLAQDKDKFLIYISDLKKYPISSSVFVSFRPAPEVFCFNEYTIEIFDSDNPFHTYGKVILTPGDLDSVITHHFEGLPTGVYLEIKIYPTEVIHSLASQCICNHCNCLVTATKPFKFQPQEIKAIPLPNSPHIVTPSSSISESNIIYFIVFPILIFLIGMLGLISCMIIVITKGRMKNGKENIQLVSNWTREDDPLIISSPKQCKNGIIWAIGLNSIEEHRFLDKLSSLLLPSSRLIFAPDHLPDGENKWRWMSEVNKRADLILLLLRDSSFSLIRDSKQPSDIFDQLFLEQHQLLHLSDHRLITVALDDCAPSFKSNHIVYRDPRDFIILTQSLQRRGVTLKEEVPISLSPSPSLSNSMSDISEEEIVREQSNSNSNDSGFVSNPSIHRPKNSLDLSNRFTSSVA
ncbi:hypothetical protein PFISCL1PPCAC_23991 [Pristionchus fissidentatus]|uniref:ILCR1 Ig-like domain-containing protein n=1 Tax=Pristionchus fissidentatus TaxID=1538716 RepID=A0AAV5WSM1_9BILA|nr:hypothetical protein PFISCL1PPCAC_23991 [Pristionchus fissidentatus]